MGTGLEILGQNITVLEGEIVKSAGQSGGVMASDDAAVALLEGGKLKASELPSSVESGSFTGDATGATDIGPALQAAFDAGSKVTLKRGGTYLWNTPVFLDSTAKATQYVLDATGAEIIYGSGLPSASTLSGLAGTKWAVFVNTKRAALSGGVVTTSEANKASESSLPPGPRFILRGGVHQAQTNIIGLAFGNGAATHLRDNILKNIQCGISWAGYVDENKAVNVQTQGASPTGGQATRIIYQRESGDGTTVENTKAYGGVHLDISGCYGFRATSCVSGQFLLTASQGVIENAHQETDEITNTPYSIFLNRTRLTLITSRTNASKSGSKCSIKIEDEASTTASQLSLIDHVDAYYLRQSPEDAKDPERGPTINVEAINNNGRIRSQGSKAIIINGWVGATQYAEGLYLASGIEGITKALAAGSDLIASGNFELAYNGTWVVSTLGGGAVPSRSLSAPSFTTEADASGITGALESGQKYEYLMAAKLADGRYTSLSTEHVQAPGATGVNKLLITSPPQPSTLVVWRYKGEGSVKTAPDHFIEIPMDGYGGTWFDTGTRINGRLWKTASVPVPNTVKGVGSIANTTEPNGALWSTFDRVLVASGTGTLEKGKAQMVLIKHKRGKFSTFNFRTGSTAAVGAGHGWAALVNLLGEVVAVTADHTEAAEMGASTILNWNAAASLNLAPGIYYAVVMASHATTEPTITSSSGAGSSVAIPPPIAAGLSPTTGLTTPIAVGETLAVPTSANAVVPYIWGT